MGRLRGRQFPENVIPAVEMIEPAVLAADERQGEAR